MRRYRIALLSLVTVVLMAATVWAWSFWRTVDGRTATAWLAFTHQASQRDSYQATGRTTWQGTPAAFTMTQGDQGRYVMRVTDASGRMCMLGHDGHYTWYQADAKTVRTANTASAPIPVHARSRILGTEVIAGRPSVRLHVQSGHVRKTLSIDRETGVVLAMVTADRQREISRMTIQRIAYQPVTVPMCPATAETTLQPITRAEMSSILGGKAVVPGWLPSGMQARGLFREWCNCCQQEMVVLRYADGLRTLTLFEVAGDHQCAMNDGCHMAPASREFIEVRRVGHVTVTAVGNVDRATLTKVVRSLQ